jgi:hypothetical protein
LHVQSEIARMRMPHGVRAVAWMCSRPGRRTPRTWCCCLASRWEGNCCCMLDHARPHFMLHSLTQSLPTS